MMNNTRTLPSIHIPIQDANGSVGWAWYMFFQWVADNVGKVDLSDYFTKEETEELLSAKANIDDLSDVAFSGDYDDLSNKPTIPTVNNATLTIQKNGTTVETFTANASSDVTANITVPTKISDLTNDSNFANTDLSNLSSVGKNISNWSSNITNCITEIPQDIKLELNAGVLTLKAGSKVYVPNGAGVFDKITIASDLTATSSGNDTRFVFYYNGALGTFPISQSYSGSSAPTGHQYMLWYDTANNLVKLTTDSGSTWTTNNSLTLGIITTNASQITSIDQVFNGLGYIGSTVYALPGVKGLIPNGRNNDGSLKNTEFTTQSVSSETFASNRTEFVAIQIKADATVGSIGYQWNGYNEKENKKYNLFNRTETTRTDCGSLYLTNGVISNFKYKTPFHTVDYNDTEYIARQAMPSDRYVNLTLGANGSTYTAPADGYFTIRGSATAAGGFVVLSNEAKQMTNNPIAYNPGGGLSAFLPVGKGDVVYVWYGNYSGTIFRFIYANGAQ